MEPLSTIPANKKTLSRLVIICLCLMCVSYSVHAKFVSTNGTAIIDEHGKPIFLSGINLGNWLLWEGYLMMGDFNYRTHTQFLHSLTTVFASTQKAKEFEHQWRLNYVNEDTLSELNRLGYNAVRVPFHFNMFWQDEQLSDHGFQYFDALINSAKKHNIYVLLDMHAAPGYQNPGDHADNLDSNASQPRSSVSFWDNPQNINIASKVWRHIARRYQDEPTIWGYDLLNEPVPKAGREYELLPSLITIRNAIREVDINHIIVAQGSWWGSDLSKIDWSNPKVQQKTGIDSQWDDKLVYQIHHYGQAKDTFGREKITNKLNIPLILGEYGETDEQNLKRITLWSKQHLAGYFPWSFKKLSHNRALWTIPPNSNYQRLTYYIKNEQVAPVGFYEDVIEFAKDNIRNSSPNMHWHPNFYDAVSPTYE
ncbi:glycoside hydrolase family 5 protein [Agarivorans aestuarii]|uniref:glycoside hydrolase family 5 protein n=1 Tax=Agarivorans aestuarii TaxID=1563703 RepID=UPI001C82438D|nr:cellulase family glycosylhydrolase [Agarivorans aestuarii]